MIRLIIEHVTLIKTDRSSVQTEAQARLRRGSGASARTGAVLGSATKGVRWRGGHQKLAFGVVEAGGEQPLGGSAVAGLDQRDASRLRRR